MNKLQKAYKDARKALEAAEKEINAVVLCDEFDDLSEENASKMLEPVYERLNYEELISARTKASDDLLEFAFAKLPTEEAETLRKVCKTNYAKRLDILNLAMKTAF